MREKLNSNPIAQVGLVAVLVVAAAFMLLKGGGGESSGEEAAPASAPTEATVSVAGTSATGTATAATPGEAVEGAVESAVEAGGAEAGASGLPVSVPTPPLPAPVLHAYKSGKIVVLLVVHDGGIDDRLVSYVVKQLKPFPKLGVFIVPAKQIARYAAITIGVDVQQVPALIVMRPRHLSHGTPQASLSYGFQTAQSVVQALVDAAYKGPEITYHPN